MQSEIKHDAHMRLFLETVGATSNHMSIACRKELIKVFGLATEIFQTDFLPYSQLVFTSLRKQANEQKELLQPVIAEVFGSFVIQYILHNEIFDNKVSIFWSFFNEMPKVFLETKN